MFELVFLAGAVAIACWSYVRLRSYRPVRLGRVCFHIIGSTLLCAGGVPFVAEHFGGHLVSPPVVVAVLVGLYLPALAYGFLAGIWALAFLNDARSRFGS